MNATAEGDIACDVTSLDSFPYYDPRTSCSSRCFAPVYFHCYWYGRNVLLLKYFSCDCRNVLEPSVMWKCSGTVHDVVLNQTALNTFKESVVCTLCLCVCTSCARARVCLLGSEGAGEGERESEGRRDCFDRPETY